MLKARPPRRESRSVKRARRNGSERIPPSHRPPAEGSFFDQGGGETEGHSATKTGALPAETEVTGDYTAPHKKEPNLCPHLLSKPALLPAPSAKGASTHSTSPKDASEVYDITLEVTEPGRDGQQQPALAGVRPRGSASAAVNEVSVCCGPASEEGARCDPASKEGARCRGDKPLFRPASGASETKLSILPTNVCQKLRNSYSFWEAIGASVFILSIIEFGYKLPFITTPTKALFKNNRSANDNPLFVNSEISKLLLNGYIKKLASPPVVVNPLSVAKNSGGKLRLILDLRYVNQCLYKFVVKYENLELVKDLADLGGFMAKFDLKSGYHHMGIFEDHQDYLGFAWASNGVTEYYKFTVLPFGLATACSIFTKFLKPLLSHWRKQGIKMLLYLDDALILSNSKLVLSKHLDLVRKDLTLAGITVNEDKSQWYPSNTISWLGLEIDLCSFRFSVPECKRSVALASFRKALSSYATTARLIAKLVGFLVSLKMAIGPMALIGSKYLQMAIRDARSWNYVFVLDECAKNELVFWEAFFQKSGICWPILEKKPPVNCLHLYTDASSVGCGGYLEGITGSQFFHAWNDTDLACSSTYRELKGLLLFLEKSAEFLKNKSFVWYTDNQNCITIMKKSSMRLALHKLRLNISHLRSELNCAIFPIWIRRSFNAYADSLSKVSVNQEWFVNDEIFRYFDQCWGPYTFDRFANNLNAKCELFTSLYDCPNTSGLDAFAYDWSNHNNWLVPPPHLIARTLAHLKRCCAHGTLVVPRWPAAPFWPLLADGSGFLPFIEDHHEYITPNDFFFRF